MKVKRFQWKIHKYSPFYMAAYKESTSRNRIKLKLELDIVRSHLMNLLMSSNLKQIFRCHQNFSNYQENRMQLIKQLIAKLKKTNGRLYHHGRESQMLLQSNQQLINQTAAAAAAMDWLRRSLFDLSCLQLFLTSLLSSDIDYVLQRIDRVISDELLSHFDAMNLTLVHPVGNSERTISSQVKSLNIANNLDELITICSNKLLKLDFSESMLNSSASLDQISQSFKTCELYSLEELLDLFADRYKMLNLHAFHLEAKELTLDDMVSRLHL